MTMRCHSMWGHKFSPRYSYAWPHGIVPEKGPGGQFSGASIEYVETMLRTGQNKTYHHDVCERCGLIVSRRGVGTQSPSAPDSQPKE